MRTNELYIGGIGYIDAARLIADRNIYPQERTLNRSDIPLRIKTVQEINFLPTKS